MTVETTQVDPASFVERREEADHEEGIDVLKRMETIERLLVDRFRQGPLSPLALKLIREFNTAKRTAQMELNQTVDLATENLDVQWALNPEVLGTFEVLERFVNGGLDDTDLLVEATGIRSSYSALMNPSAS